MFFPLYDDNPTSIRPYVTQFIVVVCTIVFVFQFLAGMPGPAEYEELIGVKGKGTSGMDAQSVAHFVIVLFIFLGNLGYFIERKRSKKHQGS